MTDDKKPASAGREFWLVEPPGSVIQKWFTKPTAEDLRNFHPETKVSHVIEISAFTSAMARIASLEKRVFDASVTYDANLEERNDLNLQLTALQEKLAVVEREAHDNSLEWHYQLEQVEKERDAALAEVERYKAVVEYAADRENWIEPDIGSPYWTLWDDGNPCGPDWFTKALNPSGGK